MNSEELFVVVFYTSIAIGLSVLAVLFMGGMFEIERRLQKWIVPALFPTIAVAIAAGSFFSGRNLGLISFDAGFALMAQATGARNLLRAITVAIMAVCVCRVASAWLSSGKARAHESLLLIAFLSFFVTNVVLNSAFGTKPTFIHNLFYPLIIVLAAYTSRQQSPALALDAAKWALLAFMLASVAAAALWPAGAVQQAYAGVLPGVSIRLWGLGSNANSIGPLAFLLLVLALHNPFSHKALQAMTLILALGVIVLSQSKTAWVAGLVACALLVYFKTQATRAGQARSDRFALAPAALAGLAVLLTGALLVASFFVDIGNIAERLGATKQGASLLTLTGRDVLWSIAIDEWYRNPLFGYGPSLWDAEYRQSIGIGFAFSAHNQLLQSLAGAGSLGALGLMFYLIVLTIYAVKAAVATQGLSVALLSLVLVRCLTEAPLATNTIFNGDFFTHLLLFVVLVSHAVRSQQKAGTYLESLPNLGLYQEQAQRLRHV